MEPDLRAWSPLADMMASEPAERIVVLIPVYDDWDSIAVLRPSLDAAFAEAGVRPAVLRIDDGSNEPMPAPGVGAGLQHLER